jgi:hypothetical protein
MEKFGCANKNILFADLQGAKKKTKKDGWRFWKRCLDEICLVSRHFKK